MLTVAGLFILRVMSLQFAYINALHAVKMLFVTQIALGHEAFRDGPDHIPHRTHLPVASKFHNRSYNSTRSRHHNTISHVTDPLNTTSESINTSSPSYFTPDDSRPIILYDGVCNLCNGGVNFMLKYDTAGNCRFAALQSSAGRALLVRSNRSPDDISSIVFVEELMSHIKSEAILRIALKLNFPFPIAARIGLAFPMSFRDAIYDFIANNRYSFFGKSTICRLNDTRFANRFIE
jgi:predicted DCC family thiol-disulfide oxidoreductase YuxK